MARYRRTPSPARRSALRPCADLDPEAGAGPFVMVIFGGAGDLARRKLIPALYALHADGSFAGASAVLAVGRQPLADGSYRRFVVSAVRKGSPRTFRADRAAAFARRFHFLGGDVRDEGLYEALRRHLEELAPSGTARAANIIYYLAVPPEAFPAIVAGLDRMRLCRALPQAKLIVEKPFGRDLASARALDRRILAAFEEDQVFRIDHYLAKETVQNILFFRFGNALFEPVWNARFIDHIQITVAEAIGIEHRGSFYEGVGVIRDIVQNHLMQLLAMVAMERPAGLAAEFVRDERSRIFRGVRRLNGKQAKAWTVLGQYGAGRIGGRRVRGYRAEAHVAPDSKVATFFAGRFYVDNARWAGVPFYLRTGKRLPRRESEIYIEFKKPPLALFGGTCGRMAPNGLILSIQPRERISLALTVKYPGMGNQPSPARMVFDYAQSFRFRPRPVYERVLFDCIRGDLTLFPRQDEVETTWALLDPVIAYWAARPLVRLPNYASGTWGPKAASDLMAREGRVWRLSGDQASR